MAQRPIIGVTGSAKRFSPSWWCIRLAVFLVGGRAVRISVQSPETCQPINGLVISGGDDIHPALYGEEAAHSDYDRERDALELRYIKTGLHKTMPILGICRGMQLLNIVKGGTLYLDINNLRRKTSKRPILLPLKNVHLESQSQLAQLLGKQTLKVNSLHHQAVRELGEGLYVAGRDQDNFIQAIESRKYPVLGLQWHPEYLWYLPSQLRVFRWLVAQSKANAT